MTNKQCLNQVKKLMGSLERGGLKVLMKEAEKLINSGALDLSEEDKDSFFAAKIVLHVALENLSRQYTPISQVGSEIAENLRQF